jgi:heterodisulfide reductase subunit A-like polyferredoxin
LTSAGKDKKALELVHQKTPFPGVLGRICHHPCESTCNRSELDEPLAICELKRFLADHEAAHGNLQPPEIKNKKNEKVAIIGAGPAGLTAANNLVRMGYKVTVFEALPVPGGMLRVGIPDYRLPPEVLQREIDAILNLGIELKLNTRLGKDITINKLFKQGFKAIFLATGAHQNLELKVKGEKLKGVYPGVNFLRDVNLGKKPRLGKKVAVIGGGNVAIDSVRTAKRMGADAFIIYRRSREEMPAYPWEIEEAIEEGIKINFLATPIRILGKNGKVVGIECIKMELGEPDESGRRRPVPIKGSEFTIKVDTVIPAIGQSPDTSYSSKLSDFKLTKRSTLLVDPDTLLTNVKGVFAGGDNVLGPASAIEAVAHGNLAAEMIDQYVQKRLKAEPEQSDKPVVQFDELDLTEDQQITQTREVPTILKPGIRSKNFNEVIKKTFTEDQAIQEATRCLNCGICSECLECVTACGELEAIDHDMGEENITLDVGSVIVATGYDQLDPSSYEQYGYNKFTNVVTGLEFERLLSASGPTSGKVLSTSSNGKLTKSPKSIVFVQCVGSRDPEHGKGYCSRVCCMYAIKEALIAKEHEPGLENITILNMDIRAFGKGFEEYYQRASSEGVDFVHGRPAEITEDPKTKELTVVVENIQKGEVEDIKADLVVLCSAILPSESNPELSSNLDIELDDSGFFSTSETPKMKTSCKVSQLESTRPGVFLAGCAESPKDIPDSVAQASGAAAKAGKFVKNHRIKPIVEEMPVTDISGEPRAGVFICNCGINIGSVVDVDKVVDYAKTLPGVVFARGNIYTCSDDAQENIQELIKEHDLNRVVIASCTPRTHEPIFRDTCKKAGLNPYLFEMANIREHCSWVHSRSPTEATEKAKDLVRMAVAKSIDLEPLVPVKVPVTSSALVIGGGIAGIRSAIELAAQDFEVHLIEKDAELGGRLNQLSSISVIEKDSKAPYPQEARDYVRSNINTMKKLGVNVHLNTELAEIDGFVGNFKATLKSHKKTREIEVGVIILAVGSETYDPAPIKNYGYGKLSNVITNVELEDKLQKGKLSSIKDAVIIQCVGAREPELENGYPGCSRYCCQVALKQALELRENGVKVTILNRDIRSFAKGAEEMYKLAAERGVKFVRFPEKSKPVIKSKGSGKANKLLVSVFDEYTNKKFILPTDAVVLSLAMVPRIEDVTNLREILKLPTSPDGFLLEAHPKLAPVETNTAGIFLAGCVQGPKNITDSLAQASAAASKAAAVISKDYIEVEPIVAAVNDAVCWGCGTCVDICEFGAPSLITNDEGVKVSKINEVLCKGCGTCVVNCPSGAITLKQFTRKQIIDMLEAFRDELVTKKKKAEVET